MSFSSNLRSWRTVAMATLLTGTANFPSEAKTETGHPAGSEKNYSGLAKPNKYKRNNWA
jgi:hypothetical protein